MADFTSIIIEPDGSGSIARFTRANSFESGDTGDAVEQLNLFLVAAGFLTEEELAKQGGDMTIVGTGTKNAAIFFSRSVGLTASNDDRNLISSDMLRAMRSFLVDEGVEINAEYYDGNAGGRELIGDFGPALTGSTTPTTPTTEPIASFIAGGTLTRINRDDGEPLWGLTFTVNGQQHIYTFDSKEVMETMLGADAVTSGKYGFMTLEFDDLNNGSNWLLGDAAMFEGQDGSYNSWFDATMKEAALEAGVRDPGKVGEFLSDPDIQRIMADAHLGDWGDARIQAEVRLTNYYQNVMYPGIKSFLDAGTPNPEAAYNSYMNSVDASLAALGYARDDDGTYRSQVGSMLGRGILADDFNTFAPTFVRAEQSQEFAATLSKWTERDLGITLDFEGWFDVLAGNSSAEIALVVEKATTQFQAERAGFGLDDATISRIADMTQLTEEQARVAFTTAEQALLAIGAQNLARFGLTEQALVSAGFGLESAGTDPLNTDGTAFTSLEIQKRARKAATELGLEDDRKANFFVGFDASGRPVRGGLAASAPEAG